MKDILDKPEIFKKIEFWAATTVFVFAVFFLMTAPDSNDYLRISHKNLFDKASIPYSYYTNYFFPQLIRYTILYLSFLLLNFKVLPGLIGRRAIFLNIFLLLLVVFLNGMVLGTTDTYLKTYLFREYQTEQDTYRVIFQKSFLHALWLLLMLIFYSFIKYISLYLLSNAELIRSKYKFITPAGLVAFVVWMISIFLLLAGSAERTIMMGWGVVTFSGILFFLYAFQVIIPQSLSKKNPFRYYAGKTFLILLLSVFLVGFLLLLLTNLQDAAIGISFFNAIFHLLFTAPLAWILFKHQMRGKDELYLLKKELGQSTANLDFLRSQINPHFLFNALNTIYGTALQEKAERTSEGIEKLGEMMRFMLQENLQDKISLEKEIAYLNNYISLQKLRTDPNPHVKIQAEIEPQVNAVQISPMLLIPFVENAFKHGISLREASHIKVSLEVKGSTLFFDVSNSKHPKQDHDPEKNKNGIGLHNVKQRLQLLYPSRHELLIRETSKEFFAHLTIHLS